MSIETLNPRKRADVEAIAGLHEQYLGDSPIVGLGPVFLRRFFYETLVEDGLVIVIFCRREDSIAGFISLTPRPLDFVSTGVRAHFLRLVWLMSLSILKDPARIRGMLAALKLTRARSGEAKPLNPAGLGEVISLVSVPDSKNYVPAGGKSRMTVRLFEEMAAWFRARKFERVTLLVKPENRASNIFCSIMGCLFEKIDVGGQPTHRYTYYFDPEAAAAAREAAAK